MSKDTYRLNYIEFDDPDDDRSTKSPNHDGGIRITFNARGVAAFCCAGNITVEDQDRIASAIEMAYWQGKEVGLKSRKTE